MFSSAFLVFKTRKATKISKEYVMHLWNVLLPFVDIFSNEEGGCILEECFTVSKYHHFDRS